MGTCGKPVDGSSNSHENGEKMELHIVELTDKSSIIPHVPPALGVDGTTIVRRPQSQMSCRSRKYSVQTARGNERHDEDAGGCRPEATRRSPCQSPPQLSEGKGDLDPSNTRKDLVEHGERSRSASLDSKKTKTALPEIVRLVSNSSPVPSDGDALIDEDLHSVLSNDVRPVPTANDMLPPNL